MYVINTIVFTFTCKPIFEDLLADFQIDYTSEDINKVYNRAETKNDFIGVSALSEMI